jgi:hypothetical protein
MHEAPFAVKDEVKCMAGSKWHGYEDPPMKCWSVSDSPRNRFQLDYLEGKNPYAHFEQEIPAGAPYRHNLRLWQHRLADALMARNGQIWAAAPGAGKTLASFSVMERLPSMLWWFVAPKTVLLEIKQQIKFWGLPKEVQDRLELMTYEAMVTKVKSGNYELPQGVFFDECTHLKTNGSTRTNAAFELVERMREQFGFTNCWVALLSGTPSPKSPLDIWTIAELACPGFLREGSPKALEARIATMGLSGQGYMERESWIESEVQLLYERLQGLMTVVTKDEISQSLPALNKIRINLEPSAKLLKLAAAIQRTSLTAVTGLSKLRQLSDGFLYQEQEDGEMTCPTCGGSGEVVEWYNPEDPDRPYGSIELLDPDFAAKLVERMTTCCDCGGTGFKDKVKREATEIPCPKIDAVIDLLGKAEADGRIGIFAGFQGSIDRLVKVCKEEGWAVFKCDGRGLSIIGVDGKQHSYSNALDAWKDFDKFPKMAFVANAESGSLGLTLVEANICIYYSNGYKPQHRTQGMLRFHRPGQHKPVWVYDLCHLPSDARVIDILEQNMRLEKMVLGEILGDCLIKPGK